MRSRLRITACGWWVGFGPFNYGRCIPGSKYTILSVEVNQ